MQNAPKNDARGRHLLDQRSLHQQKARSAERVDDKAAGAHDQISAINAARKAIDQHPCGATDCAQQTKDARPAKEAVKMCTLEAE